jgi:hypothetical protein
MKKTKKKLVLAKETLSQLTHAVGADTAAFNDCMGTMFCPPPNCPTGMYASCEPSPRSCQMNSGCEQ